VGAATPFTTWCASSPTAKRGHFLKLLYGYQRKGHPPAVEIIANHPESTRTSYVRYLEDEIREAFDMKRTPLQVVMKLKRQAHKKNPKKQIARRK
jgi:GTP-binding protein